MSNIKDLLIVTESDKNKIRNMYNKTEEGIKKYVAILIEWLNRQPHLPKFHDVNRLERFLLLSDFQVEDVKHKLDQYYTYRGLYPDFFINIDPQAIAMQNFQRSVIWISMPKLLPTMERLVICKYTADDNSYNFRDFISYVLMDLDIKLSYDYAPYTRCLIDMSNMTLKHIAKMEPNLLCLGELLYQAFSGRVTHFEYIDMPPVFDTLLDLFKRAKITYVLPKIRTHKNLDALYQVIPKEYLPKEYGGSQPSIYKLHDKWHQEMIYQKQFLQENAKWISNEDLRIGEPIHEKPFGNNGSFKVMNID